MGKAFRIETEGIKETMKGLDIASKDIGIYADKGVMDAALFLLGEVKQSIAGRRAEPKSVDTGQFLNSISVAKSKIGEAIVFSPLQQSKFMEYGTSPHYISPRNAQALHWLSPGGGARGVLKGVNNFSKGHMVKGVQPRGHFQNSLNRNKEKVHFFIKRSIKQAKNIE